MVLDGHWRFGKLSGLKVRYFVEGSLSLGVSETISKALRYWQTLLTWAF